MGEAAKRLLDELMALSEDERELVAVELNLRLRADGSDWEDAWTQVIDRRAEEVRTGSLPLRTWDEIKADLRS